MRSLFLNIKDKGNPGLRNEIVLGQVTPDKVVRMSKEEMASESVRLLNEKLAEKNLFKAKAVGVTQVSTQADCRATCAGTMFGGYTRTPLESQPYQEPCGQQTASRGRNHSNGPLSDKIKGHADAI